MYITFYNMIGKTILNDVPELIQYMVSSRDTEMTIAKSGIRVTFPFHVIRVLIRAFCLPRCVTRININNVLTLYISFFLKLH